MSLFMTSYIKTTGAAASRVADAISFPFLGRPQTMTCYSRFVELGAILGTPQSASPLYWSIGNSNTARLVLFRSATRYRLEYDVNTVAVTATINTPGAIGDTVELCARLTKSGQVTLIQSSVA